MGEYAEMMLDGTLCQFCGEYLGGDAGYPQSCGCDAGPQDHDLYIVKKPEDLDAIAELMDKIEFDKYVKGRRDRKGQLMIGLKNKGKNAGLFVFRNEDLYAPALNIIRGNLR